VKSSIRPSSFLFFIFIMVVITQGVYAQPLSQKGAFTRQDSLRGSIGPGRDWWDVVFYNIYVAPDYKSRTIKGSNEIGFTVTKPGKGKTMQIDLQQPMTIESITLDEKAITEFIREGNVYWINLEKIDFTAGNESDKTSSSKKIYNLKINFKGGPRVAVNPPWDGGWIFAKDALGRPWMSVACQGLGASVWYPCKDHQSDEPENAILHVSVPDTLVAVGNGKQMAEAKREGGNIVYTWAVNNPINNYNIVPYIGKYVHWSDSYTGEAGQLSLDYWVLDYNLEKSKKQFNRDVKPMMKCFEYWFGPYPFYRDGYKLVESPHLGMEHQSATAYGNQYVDGYYVGAGAGMDLSGSGWGKNWDYIIIHESGHEWFGNNITTNDIADMWVHEGFTDYSETLFVECQYGKKAGDEYTWGLRKNIENRKPIIGIYGVNQEGSGDMYYKGSNLIHTIRQLIDDDSLFRDILRGLNKDFYHKTVDTKQVEQYISKKAKKDFSKIFDQYLRNIKIPVLEYRITGDNVSFRWTNVVNGFDMPVKLAGSSDWIKPTTEWSNVTVTETLMKNFQVDRNFYITLKKVD
jgi:aminopeptidase N